MKTKQIDVGRITGLSTYELAVKHGFTGTEEEYIAKEIETYQNMIDFATEAKAKMEQMISNVTDAQTGDSNAEVTTARGDFKSLDERLDSSESALNTIISRLSGISGGDVVSDAIIDDEGYLVISVKDGTEDKVHGNIELRRTKTQIQWRSNGYKDWTTLIYIRDLMPKITNLTVNSINCNESASGEISGNPDEMNLTLNVPSGQDGCQILNARVDDEGYLWFTVSNNDFVLAKAEEIVNGMPILRIGDVNTVSFETGASASIGGSPTNPVLNLSIPSGKTTKLTRAYVGSDGFLVFDYDK